MEITKRISVEKVSGDKVPYSPGKLRRSLERSGAGIQLIDEIQNELEGALFDGISTKAIHRKAFSLLRNKARSNAARYRLKQAIIELGPTGFPFERFVGALLKYQGFKIKVGVDVQGHCISHEVDVVAEKEKQHYMVECKFHSDQKRKCGVQVPLYIQSRFLDVKKQWEKRPEHQHKFHQGWIVTNTRFTQGAIKYGNCMGLNLIGWDHPKNGSLKERIDISGLHPITCLTTLTRADKQKLLESGSVLCREICADPKILNVVGIKHNKHRRVLAEALALCKV